MADVWKNYLDYKTTNELSARYYAFIANCFEEGIKTVTKSRPSTHALDIACGAGDNTGLLIDYAQHITGIDSSAAQIQLANANPKLNTIKFLQGDFLQYSPDCRFDLITAAWFHNFLHDADTQQQVAQKIADCLTDNGAIVFLFPSDSFTRSKTRQYAASFSWQQTWYETHAQYMRGLFSFQDSPWDKMTCWQPLFLAEIYHPLFELHFLDTKKICIERGFLDDAYLNPTFEVMYGFKRIF